MRLANGSAELAARLAVETMTISGGVTTVSTKDYKTFKVTASPSPTGWTLSYNAIPRLLIKQQAPLRLMIVLTPTVPVDLKAHVHWEIVCYAQAGRESWRRFGLDLAQIPQQLNSGEKAEFNIKIPTGSFRFSPIRLSAYTRSHWSTLVDGETPGKASGLPASLADFQICRAGGNQLAICDQKKVLAKFTLVRPDERKGPGEMG